MKLAKFGRHKNTKTRIISSKCASGYVASRTFMLMDPVFDEKINPQKEVAKRGSRKCNLYYKMVELSKILKYKKPTHRTCGSGAAIFAGNDLQAHSFAKRLKLAGFK